MAMTIFYILWASIKSRYDSKNKMEHSGGSMKNNRKSIMNRRMSKSFYVKTSRDMILKRQSLVSDNQEINKFTIDCSKSTTGLFVGTFVLLVTVIVLKKNLIRLDFVLQTLKKYF
jgi:hypothetical protein